MTMFVTFDGFDLQGLAEPVKQLAEQTIQAFKDAGGSEATIAKMQDGAANIQKLLAMAEEFPTQAYTVDFETAEMFVDCIKLLDSEDADDEG